MFGTSRRTIAGLAAIGWLLGCGDDPAVQSDAAPVDATALDAAATPDAIPSPYRVHGTATGLIDVENLRLSAAGVDEVVGVSENGDFSFALMLPDGAAYTVVLDGGSTYCTLEDATGTIAGADAQIALICGLLDDVQLDSPRADFSFSPTQLAYHTEVAIMQASVSVTAVALRPGIESIIAGQMTESGIPGPPIDVPLGETVIPVVARHPASGNEMTYEFTVDRAGDILQAAYVKSSNSEIEDVFGVSLSLDAAGDTMAVGAFWEDSSATGVNGDQADDSASRSGAVYVFARSGDTWVQQNYLKASNTDGSDLFGGALALNAVGDTLAVGAHGERSAATGSSGAGESHPHALTEPDVSLSTHPALPVQPRV